MDFKFVANEKVGTEEAKKVLYKICDKNTVLFLSGGKTPKPLYEELAKEQKLKVGAVAMVDDRYGLPMHPNSNEQMIANTGLFQYARTVDIPVYLQLKRRLSIKDTTKEYDETVRYLFKNFPKRIAVLGIGSDGHTAGILPMYHILIYDTTNKNSLVSAFEYQEGEFKERISLTFKALSEMDHLILLVFGEEKKKALEEMFKKGPIEQVPARFFNRPEVLNKTLLITDQRV